MAIGGERIEIEGDDRGAGRLRTPNALNGRMQSGHWSTVAGDEAGRGRFLARRDQPRPQVACGWTIVDQGI
jgi:hypothetical protein